MKYQGSCHCGSITFEVDGEISSLTECNCSICSRRGYLLWFVQRAQLDLKTPESAMSTYTFNKHVIKHNFCPTCGCAPLGFGRDGNGHEMVAVNARCLDGVNVNAVTIDKYDGRSV